MEVALGVDQHDTSSVGTLGAPPRPAATGRSAQAVRGSIWSVASVLVASVSGFGFWFVASRLNDPADIGSAQKLWTAIQFVNYLTSMGLPVAVARYARDDAEDSRVLFKWAVLYTTATSIVGTAGYFLIFTGDVAARLSYWGRPIAVLLFFLSVAGMSLAFLVEVRLMTLRRWGWVMSRVLLLGLARFPLLWFTPLDDDALWLFLLVAGTPALTGFIGVVLIQGRGSWRLWPVPTRTVDAFRYASVNYVGLLTEKAPAFVLPLIVSVRVGAAEFATFYYVWMVTLIVFLVPETVGRVLVVEGGKDGARIEAQARSGLLLTMPAMVAVAIGAFVWPDIIPTLFGSDFSEASEVFPRFMAAGVLWAVTTTALARARVVEDAGQIVAITGTFAVATLVPAFVLTSRSGLSGAADAWVIGHVAAALVAIWTLVVSHRRAVRAVG